MTSDIPRATSTSPTQRALIAAVNVGLVLARTCGAMGHPARVNVEPDLTGTVEHRASADATVFRIATFAYGGLLDELGEWLDTEHAAAVGIDLVVEPDNALLDPIRARIAAECADHAATVDAREGGAVLRHGDATFVIPVARLGDPAAYVDADAWLTAQHAET